MRYWLASAAVFLATSLFTAVTGASFLSTTAQAVVGGSAAREAHGPRAVTVRVEAGRGLMCTGVVIAPDLVLTAAHCLIHGGRVFVVSLDPSLSPRRHNVSAMAVHPSFVAQRSPRTQPGTDLAMIRLAKPLPADMTPVRMGGGMWTGESLAVAGFGVGREGAAATARILRAADLVGGGDAGAPNGVVIAFDARTEARTSGAGACRGDSGGPVLRGAATSTDLVGIVSWAGGPLEQKKRSVCGGYTSFTQVSDHNGWISSTAATLGKATPEDGAARYTSGPNQ
jgi:secreted trypsin-like serine protease